MKFEAGKEYKTRDGRKARVYATDGGEGTLIHGAVCSNGQCILYSWEKDGRLNIPGIEEQGVDLMPNPRELWVNVYGDSRGDVIHKSETDALRCACDGCLKTIKVREVLEDE